MLAQNFTYKIEEISERKYEISLMKNSSEKIKRFVLVSPNKQGVIDHMESLTDVICNDFMKSA